MHHSKNLVGSRCVAQSVDEDEGKKGHKQERNEILIFYTRNVRANIRTNRSCSLSVTIVIQFAFCSTSQATLLSDLSQRK